VASGFSRKNDASSQLPPEGGSHGGQICRLSVLTAPKANA